MKSAWYNFKTNEYDYLENAPDDYTDYLPQIDAAQGLYKVYQMKGLSPQESAIKVLEAVVQSNRKD